MKFGLIVLIICGGCFTQSLRAQTLVAQSQLDHGKTLARYGLYGNLGLVSHTADFRAFPGVPNCCPKFQNGTGTGLSFGALYDIPLAAAWWLSFRLGYEDYSAKLTTREQVLLSGGIQGEFEHRVTSSLASLGLETSVSYSPIRNLSIGAGLRSGYVLTKDFTQVEVIVQPADQGVFSNGRSTRNELAGSITSASTLAINLLTSISYDLPLNAKSTLFLVPEIQYSMGMLPIISDYEWKANALHLGIALKYAPQPSVDVPQVIPEEPKVEKPIIVESKPTPKVIEKKKNILTASISAVSVDANEKEQPLNKITIEEFASTALHPLLQYVFFDENSAEIPRKYSQISQEQSRQFSLRDFIGTKAMDVYHSVLNVVGYRMKNAAQSTITLTGCNSNEGSELTNTTLSKSRAENVKKYLVDVWGITPKRIKIDQRNLPSNPSNSTTKEGLEENRRVEISSNEGEIITPIIIDDTLRRMSTSLIRFHTSTRADAGLAEWTLTAKQEKGLSAVYTGTSALQPTIDWNIAKEYTSSNVTSSLSYDLTIRDTEGQVATSKGQIQIEQVTIQNKRDQKLADKIIDRYSLILFDFDKADLDKRNQSIISFIKKRISPEAVVSITGYTDITGDEEHNNRLAQQRATATAQALGLKANVAEKKGEQQFSNTTPEGRFYNRTVEILVETAVK